PGHIAKAEKALFEQLKRVDVVLEVRDARIPLASHHPQIAHWVGNRARVLILNRVDLISPPAHQQWLQWFQSQGEVPYFTDAQQGKGIAAVAKAAQAVGIAINQRRHDRGMQARPVRATVIGFPNVGKSALINRLLNRRVVKSARQPGVTRQLRWVRISNQLDLLDTPGVLPAKLSDQQAAYKLAICDDIGQAAYDFQRVAARLVELLKSLSQNNLGGQLLPEQPLQNRYQLDTCSLSGEDYLLALAQQRYQGDVERSARQILTDFRKGLLGAIVLELPPCIGESG
ncbi:MAG TPA: ribosome biogenesis GTPase YlqF, partial [Candidatus Caenarcaniphilales bacterium]